MSVDLGHDWDFWPYFDLPLDEARHRLGVPPPDPKFVSGIGVYGPPIGIW